VALPKLLRRLAITTALGVVGLALLVAGYTWYTVASFDTETLPARYGQLDTQLSAPPGAPRPLIVGFGGAEGGNAWTRDRWVPQRQRFEAQGYAFLAVGYFGLENTPADLDRIALEAISAAIRDAAARPEVADGCAILLGGSKGAELALALAANDPTIDAVVALSPSDTVFPAHTQAMTTSSWALDGKPLPFAPMPWSATLDLVRGNILGVMERILANETAAAAAAIPVERIGGPILLVSSTHDEMWPASRMARRMIARLDASGFPHLHEHVEVEGDHAAVVDDFGIVEEFLARAVASRAGCEPVQGAG
jgi:dipeptidyl aminopeptidase/acylaminoacyl peptidase